METCPCGSALAFNSCCEPIILGDKPAPTAESLMRSRYASFVTVSLDHLMHSVHPDKRKEHDRDAVAKWASESEWHGLEILNTEAGGEGDETGTVEFVAEFTEKGKKRFRHHELAQFKKVDGDWYFYDGSPVKHKQVVRNSPKLGRNDPCSCGSGKKYKKCCAKG